MWRAWPGATAQWRAAVALLILCAGLAHARAHETDGGTELLAVPDGFIQGTKWGLPTMGTGATVTYSYDLGAAGEVSVESFLPAGYQTPIDAAFQAWADVADITFVEVPSGGDIRLVGFPIDGPGGVGANATYPGAGYNRVRFDSTNEYVDDAVGANKLRVLAMHEIGHAIGLLHPPGILARMNHRTSDSFANLLPSDVAAIQSIYGPAPGSDPADYEEVDVTTFDLTSASNLSFRVSLEPFFDVARTADVTGTLNGRITWGSDGLPQAFALYSANLNIADMQFQVDTALLNADLQFTDVLGTVMHADWFGPTGQPTPVANGEFSVEQTIVGLIDGQADYNVVSSLLGVDQSGLFDFEFVNMTGAGPQAFATTPDGRLGRFTRDGQWLDLELPISVLTDLPVASAIGDIPVSVEVVGTIYARVLVPEPSSLVLAAGGMFGLLLVGRRRRKGRCLKNVA